MDYHLKKLNEKLNLFSNVKLTGSPASGESELNAGLGNERIKDETLEKRYFKS